MIKILKGPVGGNIAGVASKNGEVVVEVGMLKAPLNSIWFDN